MPGPPFYPPFVYGYVLETLCTLYMNHLFDSVSMFIHGLCVAGEFRGLDGQCATDLTDSEEFWC